jgi:AbrB family looped-hinge helix DNA binding protein
MKTSHDGSSKTQATGKTGFLGSSTVGARGQIVIPADARDAMQVKEGDKVVVLRGPREGSIIVFRVDSFDRFLARAELADSAARADGDG